jgi:hypothetical protein
MPTRRITIADTAISPTSTPVINDDSSIRSADLEVKSTSSTIPVGSNDDPILGDLELKSTTSSNNTHRLQFDAAAFGPGNKKNCKLYSRSQLDSIAYTIKHWDTGDTQYSNRKSFRKAHKVDGYRIYQNFTAKDYVVNDKATTLVFRKINKKDGTEILKQAVCMEDTFDLIQTYHSASAHKKVASTYHRLSAIYYNITAEQVSIYCSLCPTCASSGMSHKNKSAKGAARPIRSTSFRDRIQADLVSYLNEPAVDHNGVTMRYLLVVKDHFSKFIWLRALTDKSAKHVAAELKYLFHEIGFPLIFQTDNGLELIAEAVYEIIKADPLCYSVTGRIRTPQDQGSVERGNQDVKKAISNAVIQSRSLDSNTSLTWVDVLGPASSAINNSVVYGNHKLTPYHHIFAMSFDCPYNIPMDIFQSVKTLDDLDNLNKEMHEILVMIGYNIADVRTQKSHPSSPDKRRASHHRKHQAAKTASTRSSPKASSRPSLSITQPAGHHQSLMFECGVSERIYDPQIKHYYIMPKITCPQCVSQCLNRLYNLQIFDVDFYKTFATESELWWDRNVLVLFAALKAHQMHKKDIVFVEMLSPNEIIDKSMHYDPEPEVKKLVTIAWHLSHYAILEFCLDTKMIWVYDGLRKPIADYWGAHRQQMLKRLKIPTTDMKELWKMNHSEDIVGVPINQVDGVNCGPIACMVIWFIFNPEESVGYWMNQPTSAFRSIVISEILHLLPPQYCNGSSEEEAIPVKEEGSQACSKCNSKMDDSTTACSVCTSNITFNYQTRLNVKMKSDSQRQQVQTKQADAMKRLRVDSVNVKSGDIIGTWIARRF